MREIEYRAWDEEKKIMVYGIQNAYDAISDIFDKNGKELDWYEETSLYSLSCFGEFLRENVPTMQYIGLKDKNGKKVYEGTLLKDPQGNIGEVFYLGNGFTIRWKRKDGSWDTDSCFGYGEVIGDIYENPELLK